LGTDPEGVAGTAEGPHGVAAGGFRAAAGEGMWTRAARNRGRGEGEGEGG